MAEWLRSLAVAQRSSVRIRSENRLGGKFPVPEKVLTLPLEMDRVGLAHPEMGPARRVEFAQGTK